MLPLIFVLCLAGICCLTPLACYLFWLHLLNRKDRPTVLAGVWDFTALIAGLCGFILAGGGLLLSLVRSNVRYGMRGNFEALRDAWHQEQLVWGLVALTYLAVVLGGIVVAGRARRRTLVVYNVEPDLLEAAVADLFDRLGRPLERRGDLWVGGVPLFELEAFAAGRAATVRWVADDPQLFQEVARHLRESLPTVPDPSGSAARWLMTGAVCCAVTVGFCAVLLGYGLALVR